MAEMRDIQPYNPEEANRQLRSQLQDTVNEARKGGKWLIRAQLAVAVATILATVCNGVTALLAYQQIEAVRISTELTRQQFNLSQRPWLAATDFRFTDVEAGKKPSATLRITNKGLTPAKMEGNLNIRIERELPTEFSYPDLGTESTVVLLQDTSAWISIEASSEIPQQIMTQLESGERLLYAYGLVEYEDPRGNTYPPTRFCQFWDPKQKIHKACNTHNTVE